MNSSRPDAAVGGSRGRIARIAEHVAAVKVPALHERPDTVYRCCTSAGTWIQTPMNPVSDAAVGGAGRIARIRRRVAAVKVPALPGSSLTCTAVASAGVDPDANELVHVPTPPLVGPRTRRTHSPSMSRGQSTRGAARP